jgi:hypothetical protein
MTLIRADGTERDVEGHINLESLQFLVGGHFQHLPLPDGRVMLMDEDGKAKGKPINRKASLLFFPSFDTVVGDVLILTTEEFSRTDNVRPFPAGAP